jgi:hypothetical protein
MDGGDHVESWGCRDRNRNGDCYSGGNGHCETKVAGHSTSQPRATIALDDGVPAAERSSAGQQIFSSELARSTDAAELQLTGPFGLSIAETGNSTRRGSGRQPSLRIYETSPRASMTCGPARVPLDDVAVRLCDKPRSVISTSSQSDHLSQNEPQRPRTQRAHRANLRVPPVLSAPLAGCSWSDALDLGECNADQASLQAAMSAVASRLINIRTKFARTFGPRWGVSVVRRHDFLGTHGRGSGP